LVIYLALMVYLALVKVLMEAGLVKVALPSQAAIFSWQLIGFVAIAGGCAVWLGPRAGLPHLWDPDLPPRRWLPFAAAMGLGLGAVNLAIHWVTGFADMLAESANVSTINAPFPGSILFYSGGAIIVESLYRLILLTFPLWLIANVILRGRHRTAVFWGVALMASLPESAGMMSVTSGRLDMMLIAGSAMYALNLFEAHLFWRHGFLAPLVFRVAFYLVWHVVGGVLGV
jgi:hypothetical protein